jgi:hypothetical protein
METIPNYDISDMTVIYCGKILNLLMQRPLIDVSICAHFARSRIFSARIK